MGILNSFGFVFIGMNDIRKVLLFVEEYIEVFFLCFLMWWMMFLWEVLDFVVCFVIVFFVVWMFGKLCGLYRLENLVFKFLDVVWVMSCIVVIIIVVISVDLIEDRFLF